MNSTNNDQTGLFGVTLAGVIAVTLSEGAFDLLDAIIGITLFIVLRAMKTQNELIFFKQLAFSVVQALCIILFSGFITELICTSEFLDKEFLFQGVKFEVRDIIITVEWIIISVLGVYIEKKGVYIRMLAKKIE